MITRPMLAASCSVGELDKLQWPALCSPKLDGIRCLTLGDGKVVTRSFKELPNIWIHDVLENWDYRYLDGEIITYTDGKIDDFNTIQSRVMSQGGGNFAWKFHVFDDFTHPELPFKDRYELAFARVRAIGSQRLCIVPHAGVFGLDEFRTLAEQYVVGGYEGIMYRSIEGPYKSGRSTLKQGWLVKYKEFADAEGIVVGFDELQRNVNTLEEDAFGLAKRAHKKSGLVSVGTLGALVLKTEWGELRVGSGFDMATRDWIWERKLELLGRVVTFKYQAFGMQEVPRFPIFKGFRHD